MVGKLRHVRRKATANRRRQTNPACGRYKSATRRASAARSSNELAPLRRAELGLKILVSAVQFRPRTLENREDSAAAGEGKQGAGTPAGTWWMRARASRMSAPPC